VERKEIVERRKEIVKMRRKEIMTVTVYSDLNGGLNGDLNRVTERFNKQI